MISSDVEAQPLPYGGNREHLGDEMRRLGVRLRIGMAGCRKRGISDVPNRLRGLVIFDEELDENLKQAQDPFQSREEDGQWTEELAQMDLLIGQRRAATRREGRG